MRALRTVVLSACAAALLSGCAATGSSSGTTTPLAFKSPGLVAVLPSTDASASMDAVVSGIAARKAAAAEEARKVALALAAKAAAKEKARLAAIAATHRVSRTGTTRAAASKHVLTEAEKAAAMKAIAEKMVRDTPPIVIPRYNW